MYTSWWFCQYSTWGYYSRFASLLIFRDIKNRNILVELFLVRSDCNVVRFFVYSSRKKYLSLFEQLVFWGYDDCLSLASWALRGSPKYCVALWIYGSMVSNLLQERLRACARNWIYGSLVSNLLPERLRARARNVSLATVPVAVPGGLTRSPAAEPSAFLCGSLREVIMREDGSGRRERSSQSLVTTIAYLWRREPFGVLQKYCVALWISGYDECLF